MSTDVQYRYLPDIPDDLLTLYLQQPAIAVDTELHGLKMYRDEICLVQLCDAEGRICLVKPNVAQPPPNLTRLMTSEHVMKVFHFALTDVGFFRTSLKISVHPFRCTRVMSKLVRTYTDSHGLKDLAAELLGVKLEKEQQQTDWSRTDLTPEQLKYAANDVIYLLPIYHRLHQMMERRPPLTTGGTVSDLNDKAQAFLPHLVELLINGYGDLDRGWQTTLFAH